MKKVSTVFGTFEAREKGARNGIADDDAISFSLGLRTVDVNRNSGASPRGFGDGFGVYVHDVEAAAVGDEGGGEELDSGEFGLAMCSKETRERGPSWFFLC